MQSTAVDTDWAIFKVKFPVLVTFSTFVFICLPVSILKNVLTWRVFFSYLCGADRWGRLRTRVGYWPVTRCYELTCRGCAAAFPGRLNSSISLGCWWGWPLRIESLLCYSPLLKVSQPFARSIMPTIRGEASARMPAACRHGAGLQSLGGTAESPDGRSSLRHHWFSCRSSITGQRSCSPAIYKPPVSLRLLSGSILSSTACTVQRAIKHFPEWAYAELFRLILTYGFDLASSQI